MCPMDQSQSINTPESLAPRLLAMINSNWITQALSVAAQLGLPDLLASGPQTSEHLAPVTGVHAPALYRLLRALVALEIVRERDDAHFALQPMGELLRSDAAASLRAWPVFASEYRWQTCGYLLDSVKTGQSARELLTGTEAYEHLPQRPEQAALFIQAMGERT